MSFEVFAAELEYRRRGGVRVKANPNTSTKFTQQEVRFVVAALINAKRAEGIDIPRWERVIARLLEKFKRIDRRSLHEPSARRNPSSPRKPKC